MKQIYCDCAGRTVDRVDCDYCDPDDYFDDQYEEPPLYPLGKLQGMTPDELISERDRQNRIHDAAVDRCEEINSPTIEIATARARLVHQELETRGFNPYADAPEEWERKQ